jgi:thiol-disulfide isomerase/thioredoxin
MKRRVPRCRSTAGPVALLLVGTALFAGAAGLPAGDAESARPVISPTAAPNFSRPDLDDRKLTLAAYRGKVVLLNFWATWCAPCLREVPRFAEWQHRYGGQHGLQVVGVSMDDEEAAVRTAYRKYGLDYPVVMGDAQLGQLYGGVFGLPVSFLIDRHGRIRFRHEGAADLDVLEGEIRKLLTGR